MNSPTQLTLRALASAAAWLACSSAFAEGEAAPGQAAAPPSIEQRVDDLTAEVRALKSAIAELVALEKRKLELVAQLAAMAPPSSPPQVIAPVVPPPLAPPPAPEARPAPSLPPQPTRARETSTVRLEGKVALPAGQIVGYVYVSDVKGRPVKNTAPVTIKQVNKQFQPSFLVVQRGTTVEFPNLDPIYHNVFSSSPGNTFDLGIYRKGDETKSVVLSSPGVVDIYCNMHSQMQASILVVPGPLFARVAEDGSFTLHNVPEGRHKLAAWSPGAKLLERTVDVKQGAFVDFTLEAKDSAHTNKFGLPYGSYK